MNQWAEWHFTDYSTNTIWGGDARSHTTAATVEEAHALLWEAAKSLINSDWKLHIGDNILSLETDGVGTKVQIYMRQFENYYQEYLDSWKTDEWWKILHEQAKELCSRMLADLTAMLFDDGILGEQAIAFTNIIDTTDAKGERAEIFFKAFSESLAECILLNQVIVTNGEIADLGNDPKLMRAIERYQQDWAALVEDIKSDRKTLTFLRNQSSELWFENIYEHEAEKVNERIKWKIQRIKDTKKFLQDLLDELDLNIGGTFLGIRDADENMTKLETLEEWDSIIVLGEKPTNKWVISPRSNGITLIRKCMKDLLWDNWENKTFEDYLEAIWDKKKNLPEGIIERLSGLKMWDIATGKTTVFNKFISQDLLWGMNWEPNVKISCLRHGTWNPQYKIYKWLGGRTDIRFDIDVTDIPQSDICALIQVAFDIDDETAASSWNMKLPFIMTCKPWEEEKILQKSKENNQPAYIAWKVEKREEGDAAVTLRGIWLNGSTVEYRESA